MYQKKIPQLFDCGILLTKEVLSGKWKTALLYNIAMGVQRPSAIQRSIPGASRRVLNVQLNELEQHGLICKTIYPQLPPKVEYYLTDFGCSLMPVIDAMTQWGDDHRAQLEQVLIKEPHSRAELADS
ncbi:MAG: helix-turn-helix transcriptional regulator [Bacteroidetes bacterium]|nr:helix-turn-helix transcriptional regulator [Fibrella sp.]